MSLLRPVKGRPDVMDPITGLIRAIANCDMPRKVYWLITVGALVALHTMSTRRLFGLLLDSIPSCALSTKAH